MFCSFSCSKDLRTSFVLKQVTSLLQPHIANQPTRTACRMSDVRNGRWAGELSVIVLSPFLPCFLFACLLLRWVYTWSEDFLFTLRLPVREKYTASVWQREAIQNRVCSLSEMVCQFCVHWAKRHEFGGWELKSKQDCLWVPLLLLTMSLLHGLSQSPGKTSVGLRKIPEEDFSVREGGWEHLHPLLQTGTQAFSLHLQLLGPLHKTKYGLR